MGRPDNVPERADDPLLGTSSLLPTIPAAWREVIQGLRDTLVYAEEERDRLREALLRTTTEFRELLVELDALRQARVAAEYTSSVRGEVVATVGRTMRTPADAILGLAGLLRGSSLLPTQRAYVDAVHGAAEALRAALNEVSDYTRLEGGTLPLEPIGFDLPLTVRDLASALGVQAGAKGVALRFNCRPDAPPRLHGDPGRVRQIVAALVGDAISRTQRGEIEVEVGQVRQLPRDRQGKPTVTRGIDVAPAEGLEECGEQILRNRRAGVLDHEGDPSASDVQIGRAHLHLDLAALRAGNRV